MDQSVCKFGLMISKSMILSRLYQNMICLLSTSGIPSHCCMSCQALLGCHQNGYLKQVAIIPAHDWT